MSKHIVVDARIRRAGTGRYVDRLLEHLQKIDQDNRYTVLIEPDDPWRPSAPNFMVTPCKYKQFSFNPLDQITFAWQLYRLKPDLVHFSMTQQPIFYFGKIVTTTHDLTMLRYTRPGRLPRWLHAIRMLGYRFLFWFSHIKSKKIIVPSRFVAQDLAKYQPSTKNKIVVTYEACEEKLAGSSVNPPGVKKPFIFHLGSPFPHKNIERLVEAFSRLEVRGDRLQLVLAGKKEFYFEQLENWIYTLPVKDSIVLPGRISDGELKWLYENAEAYVLPALSEGFGLPGLEAMIHGCPLISSNATCLPEIYGHAAEFFDPENVEEMAKAISKVLDDKALRSKLIALGSAQAKKYSWAKMATQTLAIYKEVLG